MSLIIRILKAHVAAEKALQYDQAMAQVYAIIDMQGQREDILYSLCQQLNKCADPNSLGLY